MLDQLFKLNRNAWHAKLMSWIWNLKPEDFDWGCPYFWLTIFNVIIFIPFSILKVLFVGLFLMIEKILDWTNDQIDKKYEKLAKKLLANPDLRPSFARREFKRFAGWLEKHTYNSEYRSLYWDLDNKKHEYKRKKYAKYIEKIKAYKEPKIFTNKEKINQLVKIAKPVAIVFLWVAVIAVAGAIGYGLVKLAILLAHIPHHGWMTFWRNELYVVIVIAILAIATFILIRVFDSTITTAIFRAIGNVFVKIWRGITRVFFFFKNLAADACPRIQWYSKNEV